MATRTKIKLDPLRIDGHEVGRVLITGASAGIGAELAREFAKHGHRLTLVARRRDELQQLAAELEREHHVDVQLVVQDLAKPAGPAAVVKAALADGEAIGILVNNAGVIDVGPFAASATDKIVGLVNLNVRALTELTSLLLPPMVERGFGRVLNVASLAAFQPVPSMAAYAASKAYVLSFSEALAEELRGSGVKVSALCPGMTAPTWPPRSRPARPPQRSCPGNCSRTRPTWPHRPTAPLMNGQVVLVPGLPNQITAAWAQVTPRWLTRYVTGFAARRADWLKVD